MNQRHHRIDFRRLFLALLGAFMMITPFVAPLGDAQAQSAPSEVCDPVGGALDEVEKAIDDNDPGEEGSNLEQAVWGAIREIHGTLDGVHGQLCDQDGTSSSSSSSSSSTSSSTTTTTPPIKQKLVESEDGLITEVARLEYEPRFAAADGRAAVVLDTETRWGYRIYVDPGANPANPPAIHTFHLDTLKDGPTASFDITLSGTTGNNATTGTDLVTAVGGGKLFLRDNASRVHVFNVTKQGDQHELVREGSYAPPLPSSVGNHTAGDAIQSLGQNRSPVPPGHAIHAMTYLEPHGSVTEPKLLVLIETSIFNGVTSQPHATYLAQWDVATGREDWQERVNACSSTSENPRRYRPALSVSRPSGAPDQREVLLGCIAGSASGEVWKIRLAENGNGVSGQTKVASVPGAGGFMADPGGRRIAVYATYAQGQFAIGVDVDRKGGVYGAAQLSPQRAGTASMGIDPTTGRLYSFAESSDLSDGDAGGLLVIDGRRQPLPQRFAYPELNPLDTRGRDRIAVDPARGSHRARVFVPLAGSGTDNENMIRVYEDRRPVVGDVPITDRDRFTQDIDEEEGKTRVSTTATTSSYGVRVLYTGGLYNALPTEAQPLTNTLLNPQFGVFPACEPVGRELVLAEIDPDGTTLSNTGLNGAAVAARVDERTNQDLSRPASACWPTQGVFARFNEQVTGLNKTLGNLSGPANELYQQIAGTRIPVESSDPDDQGPTIGELLGMEEIPAQPVPGWPEEPPSEPDELSRDTVRDPFPFHPAICSQPGDTSTRPLPDDHEAHGEDDYTVDVFGLPVNAGPAPGFTALTACAEDGRTLVTHATAADTLGAAGTLSFDGARTTSRLVWKDDGGVAVVTESRVKGVSIAGVLRIGEVRSRAVSKAAGRPGTATTSVTREWCGVVGLSGDEENRSGCQNVDDPEFQEDLNQFNENILTRRNLELRVTPIDPDLRNGTPGGALAALQKDRFLVAGESFLNNDDRSNVAALELIEVTDKSGDQGRRARHIYQLAGIEGSTSYNISPIPQFDFQPFGLPTFDGPGGVPPSASEVLAGTADRRTPRRVVGAEPASNAALSPPPAAGGLLEALGGGLRWLLRNPLEALKFMALLATAWALPLHLHEKRRMLTTATVPGRN